MSHPSEALLLAFADHELEGAQRREVEAHVQRCDLCRHALREVEQAMAGLTVELALLDASAPGEWHASPAIAPARRVGRESSPARVGAGERMRAQPASVWRPERTTPTARRVAPLRWAAALVLVVGGGAAAMSAPTWFASASPAPAVVAELAATATPPAASSVVSSAAVSILPAGGAATVVLTSGPGASDARVIVELSDRSDVQVTVTTATSEHATPRFTSAEGRLAVQLTGRGALVRVAIPANLRAARITHDGATVVTVADGVVAPAAARVDGIRLATPVVGVGAEQR